jgi:hypothetical protein
MNCALTKLKLRKQQIRQSILILLIFCATFFAHSKHVIKVELGQLPTFELHDCHLCQQGLDSPPVSIVLQPLTPLISNNEATHTINDPFISVAYVSPMLRAPPQFL